MTSPLPAAIAERLRASAEVKQRTAEECSFEIARAAELIADCLRNGGKLLLCGNGGSAADSQHIAAEFIGLLNPRFPRRPWPAIALTANTSILTALANDFGYEHVFARQMAALGAPGDVLVMITSSGKSPNLLRAAETAVSQGVLTIGLLGNGGGVLRDQVDIPIVVPSDNTQFIQETHIAIGHVLCEMVEGLLSDVAEERNVVLAG